MLYGTLLGMPFYDPTRGIRMIFEAAHFEGWDDVSYGVWRVTIEGRDLESVWHHLSSSKECVLREVEENQPPRKIKVEPFELRGYSEGQEE